MTVMALGLNHLSAPLDLRARFAVPTERLAPTLRALRGRLGQAPEVALVSTCNRTELYLGRPDGDARALAGEALGWLAETGGMSSTDELERHTYLLQDAGAARHTFRLASGLASMVVGETQILGQMKTAVREADGAGTLGPTLHQLFQRSFSVAKDVRSGTEIGMHTISLAAAIVRQASGLFEDFGALRVLLVGAGEMAAPVLAHIAARGPKQVTVANRSLERARALGTHFEVEAVGLADGLARLAEFDLVIACTSSPMPVVGHAAVEAAIKARRRRPMMMVDLAVPRDIDAEVGALSDVYLYTIDDLARIVAEGGEKRAAAVGQAETIIEAGVQDFQRWLDGRRAVPMIQALQRQAEDWRTGELQRARKLLAKGEDIDAVLEALSRGLTQKMLHGPMAGLQSSAGDERNALSESLSKLFLRCPMRSRGGPAAT